MNKSIKYAILAAGQGRRLASEGVPKPLVCVGGRPLIARLIDAFALAGADEVFVTVNPACKPLDDFLCREQFDAEVGIVPVAAATPLESLAAALEYLGSGPCIVATADTAVNPKALARLVAEYSLMPPGEGLLAASAAAPGQQGLYIIPDASGNVTALSDTPIGTRPFISAGIYAFDISAGLQALTRALASGGVRLRDFQRALLQICKMKIFDIGESVDVDTPADLASARKMFEK